MDQDPGSSSDQGKKTDSVYKGIVISIFLAAATAVIGYAVGFIDEHRKAQIGTVNTRIEKLYGPLYAYSVASKTAWEELLKFRGGKPYYFNDEDMPSAEQVEIWRRWIKAVLMPLNLKMESAIIENSQLLDGNRIYPVLVDFIVHAESYKATIARWKDTDDISNSRYRTAKENTAVINYPPRLDHCIEVRLKAALKLRDALEKSWTGFFINNDIEKFDDDCS
jgi:hypothetical protein